MPSNNTSLRKINVLPFYMNYLLSQIPIKKKNVIHFVDMQKAIQTPKKYIIINTLLVNEQKCLIRNTVSAYEEEKIINDFLEKYETQEKIIVLYGRNSCDPTVDKKYQQLRTFGFRDIYIYSGGLFEWLLLQDIYGNGDFPTTSIELDILKYSGESIF
jgi:hypothetical protein